MVHLNGVSKAHDHATDMCGVVCAEPQDIVEFQLDLDGNIDALNRGHVERRAERGAFGARAVVAADIDDERVVELAQVVDGLDHPADFVVGVGHIGGEDIRLADEQLLLIGIEAIPLRQAVRPGRELGVCRDHAELLLVGEDRLAQGVPAFVEQVHIADLLDPLRCGLMRCMRAAGHVITDGVSRLQTNKYNSTC